MYARSCANMGASTHICAQLRIYAHIYTYICPVVHICAHLRIYARSYAYTRASTHICVHLCIYARSYAYMRRVTHTCAQLRIYARSYAYMPASTHICTHGMGEGGRYGPPPWTPPSLTVPCGTTLGPDRLPKTRRVGCGGAHTFEGKLCVEHTTACANAIETVYGSDVEKTHRNTAHLPPTPPKKYIEIHFDRV